MYKTSENLLTKFGLKEQTKAAGADPRPLVYITRNQTPITYQRYWEKKLITETVGTRSSIALRRPEGSSMADMVFLAQVEGGSAVIRSARPEHHLSDMVFEHVKTIPSVSELSILFDGVMRYGESKFDSVTNYGMEQINVYTVGELPIVFYVNTDGSFKYLDLNDETITGTIADNAVNVASIRGLYSESIGLDDGIFCFYVNTDGQLWEARYLDGAIVEVSQISLLPDGVTGWEDIWAGRTFDYRIALQLKGDNGNVYTLMSKSRPGGYTLNEYMQISGIQVEGRVGFIPPELISVENVGV